MFGDGSLYCFMNNISELYESREVLLNAENLFVQFFLKLFGLCGFVLMFEDINKCRDCLACFFVVGSEGSFFVIESLLEELLGLFVL